MVMFLKVIVPILEGTRHKQTIADQVAVCLCRVPSKNGTIILRNIPIADQIAFCLCRVPSQKREQ